MNGRDAVLALLDGKSITRSVDQDEYVYFCQETGIIAHEDGEPANLATIIKHDDWREWTAPLTDKQLIAEWERDAMSDKSGAHAYLRCARMLRERKL